MIKHVSFDVWNTLISPNPDFAAARADYLSQITRHPIYVVRETYTDVKRQVDRLAENYGVGLPTTSVYSMLAHKLQWVQDDIAVRRTVECMFLLNPPKVLAETVAMVHALRERGITTSIGSNSNFISGAIMRPWLESVFGPFDFYVFSDLEGISKPHVDFFTKITEGVTRLHGTQISSRSIMHVGDSVKCDTEGAVNAKMSHLLVSGPVTDLCIEEEDCTDVQ